MERTAPRRQEEAALWRPQPCTETLKLGSGGGSFECASSFAPSEVESTCPSSVPSDVLASPRSRHAHLLALHRPHEFAAASQQRLSEGSPLQRVSVRVHNLASSSEEEGAADEEDDDAAGSDVALLNEELRRQSQGGTSDSDWVLDCDSSTDLSDVEDGEAASAGEARGQAPSFAARAFCPQGWRSQQDAAVLPRVASEPSPLVQFLRRAQSLKQTLEDTARQQELLHELLILHPQVAAPEAATPCCWCAAYFRREGQSQSCLVLLQIEAVQQTLKETSSQLEQQQRDLHLGEVLLQEQLAREQEQHDHLSSLLPLWTPSYQRKKTTTAATASELRIRRSVLRQHAEQLALALEQQQQLQQEARARWYLEAADAFQETGDSSEQIPSADVEAGSPEAGGCTQATGWTQLCKKREKLHELQESLEGLQNAVALLQQQQQTRSLLHQKTLNAVDDTRELTAAAAAELLAAHKSARRGLKMALCAVGSLQQSLLVLVVGMIFFFFFVFPHSSLLELTEYLRSLYGSR